MIKSINLKVDSEEVAFSAIKVFVILNTPAADGKKSMIWTYHGYEFVVNGKSVAAVQTAAKQYVWLANDLDPKMKTILATAAAVMLFHDM